MGCKHRTKTDTMFECLIFFYLTLPFWNRIIHGLYNDLDTERFLPKISISNGSIEKINQHAF